MLRASGGNGGSWPYQMPIWERHWYLLRLRIALGAFFPAAEGTSLSSGEVVGSRRAPSSTKV